MTIKYEITKHWNLLGDEHFTARYKTGLFWRNIKDYFYGDTYTTKFETFADAIDCIKANVWKKSVTEGEINDD